MYIFSLLGIILDDVASDNFYFLKTKNDDDTVCIETTGINVSDYLPYVLDGDKVIFNFGYNSKYNDRGYLDSIVVIASNNTVTTYEVGEKIISELSVHSFDEIYFSICEEIIL